jgi:hypothetical protein
VAITLKAAKKLRAIFLDTDVTIYLKDMNVVTIDEQHGEMKITTMAQGYVIDIDENFYYLGLPNGEITRTISHETAQMVESLFVGEQMDFDMPNPDEDIH